MATKDKPSSLRVFMNITPDESFAGDSRIDIEISFNGKAHELLSCIEAIKKLSHD